MLFLGRRRGFGVVLAFAVIAGTCFAQEPVPSQPDLDRGAALWHHAFADCELRYPGSSPDDKFSGANLCAQWVGQNDMTQFDACKHRTPGDLLSAQRCTERALKAWISQQHPAGRLERKVLSIWASAERDAENETETDMRMNFTNGYPWTTHGMAAPMPTAPPQSSNSGSSSSGGASGTPSPGPS